MTEPDPMLEALNRPDPELALETALFHGDSVIDCPDNLEILRGNGWVIDEITEPHELDINPWSEETPVGIVDGDPNERFELTGNQ